jgi:hypothetical protein
VTERAKTISKADLKQVLRRVGMAPEHVEAILAALDDPIVFDRDRAYLEAHGLTRDILTDMLGGSP